MSATYVVIRELLGEQCFRAICHLYIKQHPSHSFSVLDYGKLFPEFLDTHQKTLQLNYLGDVARLEFMLEQANYGCDHTPIDYQSLLSIQALEQENIIFEICSNANLLETSYPVDQIWQAIHPEVREGSGILPEDIDMGSGEYYYIVWRPQDRLEIERITRQRFEILSEFNKILPFSEVCNNLLTYPSKPNIIEELPILINNGYFTKCYIQPS